MLNKQGSSLDSLQQHKHIIITDSGTHPLSSSIGNGSCSLHQSFNIVQCCNVAMQANSNLSRYDSVNVTDFIAIRNTTAMASPLVLSQYLLEDSVK